MTNNNERAEDKKDKDKHFKIQIDRIHYEVSESTMTGAQLRGLPDPEIGSDRDLFEVVPGGTDKKIALDEPIDINNGKRFFTAPAQINPGR